MGEKSAQTVGSLQGLRRDPSRWLKVFVVLALICFVIFQFPGLAARMSSRHYRGFFDTRISYKLTYSGERIAWEECGELIGRKLECSEVLVPMDQYNLENSGNKTFTIPLIRLRGKNATKNILLNPGGPGASGIQLMYRQGERLNAIIGEGFHLLSFDPRGINSSKPMASCFPNNESRRSLSYARDSKPIEDSVEMYTWAKNFVKACPDTMGEHGSYINTPQTAADMNSILDALGQQDMVYWGFSYGTILGQTYATLFPERSERVIIDGVANNFDWYEDPLDLESLTDADNVLFGFFDECMKAGDNCSLSSLAGTKEELQEKVLGFAENLDEPLSVYVNNTAWGTLDRAKILGTAIFPSLYKPATWYGLADRLAKLLQGNATDAFLAYGLNGPWDSLLEGESNSFVVLNDCATGPDHWPQNRKDLLDFIIPAINSSSFAFANINYYQRQQWTIPKTHNFKQKPSVKTAHPMLILSTTFDPVCPLISARSAKAAFVGSQIVELKGYGHCSLAMPSNCIASHVRAFLYNGTVPENYTQCDIDGPYFFKPKENGAVARLMNFEEPEDQRIHKAQLEIAQDETWPYFW